MGKKVHLTITFGLMFLILFSGCVDKLTGKTAQPTSQMSRPELTPEEELEGLETPKPEEIEEEPSKKIAEEPTRETESKIILTCPESCDDDDPCTEDFCSEETNYECEHEEVIPCDGNGICEEGEYSSSPDCPDCDDDDDCMEDSYDYELKKCKYDVIIPCCGNGECDDEEDCITCQEDCECPKEFFNFTTDHVVISEIQVVDHEFVELYNPLSIDVDMNGWYLSYFPYSRNWNEPYQNWPFPSEAIISNHGFYLINVHNLVSPDPDWVLLTKGGTPYRKEQFRNTDGSVAIFSFDPTNKTVSEAREGRIDAIGWGSPEHVYENTPHPAPNAGESLERKSNGIDVMDDKGNGWDAENNDGDFIVRTDPEPQNSFSAIEILS